MSGAVPPFPESLRNVYRKKIIIIIIIVIIIVIITTFIIRGIVVGLVTSFVLEDTASESQRGNKFFLLPDAQAEPHSGSNSICTGREFFRRK
jgi:amino acid permease